MTLVIFSDLSEAQQEKPLYSKIPGWFPGFYSDELFPVSSSETLGCWTPSTYPAVPQVGDDKSMKVYGASLLGSWGFKEK